ncbi:MAG: tetratricopeptide repeat protein [Candidatus Latescibacterota bacterium]
MSSGGMPSTKAAGLLLGLMAACLLACAAGPHEQGRRLLAREDYAGATAALQAALQQEPNDVAVLVDLATALYRQGELEQALVHGQRARQLAPDEARAAALVGLVHEKRGDTEAAIAAYRSYSQMSRVGKGRSIVKAHLDRLIREQIQQDTRRALAQEAALDVAAIPDSAIAVAPFRHLGGDAALEPLCKGLAEMMVTDLSKVPGLKVVERLRMQEMMQEIGLGMTGAVDAATAPRLGKLLGASRLVNGSFADLEAQQVRLDLSVAGVKTGAVESSQVAGPLEHLFRLQKDLTFGIVEAMGIALTDEQRDAIQQIPTENMLAFIAYSQGLDLDDQGKSQEAAAAFQEAAALDPGFGAALDGLERAEGAALGSGQANAVEGEVLGAPAAAGAQPAAGGTRDRLQTTGAYAGAGFLPATEDTQADVRKPVEEVEQGGPQAARVRIQVSLP